MNIVIPSELRREFQTDYDAWCVAEGIMSMTVQGEAVEDGSFVSPFATTNTSNAVQVKSLTSYPDLGGTFSRFVKEYPRWTQYLK